MQVGSSHASQSAMSWPAFGVADIGIDSDTFVSNPKHPSIGVEESGLHGLRA